MNFESSWMDLNEEKLGIINDKFPATFLIEDINNKYSIDIFMMIFDEELFEKISTEN